MKFSHVGKQPTSLNGGLGSVSQISMATQITLGSRKNATQVQQLQSPVVLNGRGPSVKQPWWTPTDWVWSMTIGKLSQNHLGRWHHRYPIRGKKSELKTNTFPSPPVLKRALNPAISEWWALPRNRLAQLMLNSLTAQKPLSGYHPGATSTLCGYIQTRQNIYVQTQPGFQGCCRTWKLCTGCQGRCWT